METPVGGPRPALQVVPRSVPKRAGDLDGHTGGSRRHGQVEADALQLGLWSAQRLGGGTDEPVLHPGSGQGGGQRYGGGGAVGPDAPHRLGRRLEQTMVVLIDSGGGRGGQELPHHDGKVSVVYRVHQPVGHGATAAHPDQPLPVRRGGQRYGRPPRRRQVLTGGRGRPRRHPDHHQVSVEQVPGCHRPAPAGQGGQTAGGGQQQVAGGGGLHGDVVEPHPAGSERMLRLVKRLLGGEGGGEGGRLSLRRKGCEPRLLGRREEAPVELRSDAARPLGVYADAGSRPGRSRHRLGRERSVKDRIGHHRHRVAPGVRDRSPDAGRPTRGPVRTGQQRFGGYLPGRRARRGRTPGPRRTPVDARHERSKRRWLRPAPAFARRPVRRTHRRERPRGRGPPPGRPVPALRASSRPPRPRLRGASGTTSFSTRLPSPRGRRSARPSAPQSNGDGTAPRDASSVRGAAVAALAFTPRLSPMPHSLRRGGRTAEVRTGE